MNPAKKLIAVLVMLAGLGAHAQDDQRRFFIRPVLGIQGAQIDGDYYAGYHKAGLLAGAFVGRNVGESTQLSFALAFSQKGARQNANPQKGNYNYYKATLNYIELPFNITHHFRRIDLYGGLYYARLISAKEVNQFGPINAGVRFKPWDAGYILGGEGKIKQDYYFGVRFSYSLAPIRDYFFNGQIYYYNFLQRLFNRGLYNNIVTFYFQYNINRGKKNEK